MEILSFILNIYTYIKSIFYAYILFTIAAYLYLYIHDLYIVDDLDCAHIFFKEIQIYTKLLCNTCIYKDKKSNITHICYRHLYLRLTNHKQSNMNC